LMMVSISVGFVRFSLSYCLVFFVVPSDNLKNKSSLLWSLCYSMGCHR
jgi:hypothetical protein